MRKAKNTFAAAVAVPLAAGPLSLHRERRNG